MLLSNFKNYNLKHIKINSEVNNLYNFTNILNYTPLIKNFIHYRTKLIFLSGKKTSLFSSYLIFKRLLRRIWYRNTFDLKKKFTRKSLRRKKKLKSKNFLLFISEFKKKLALLNISNTYNFVKFIKLIVYKFKQKNFFSNNLKINKFLNFILYKIKFKNLLIFKLLLKKFFCLNL